MWHNGSLRRKKHIFFSASPKLGGPPAKIVYRGEGEVVIWAILKRTVFFSGKAFLMFICWTCPWEFRADARCLPTFVHILFINITFHISDTTLINVIAILEKLPLGWVEDNPNIEEMQLETRAMFILTSTTTWNFYNLLLFPIYWDGLVKFPVQLLHFWTFVTLV